MKIAQDVGEYAKEQNLTEEKALAVGMAEKSKEFLETGAEIYQGNLPEGAKEHHETFSQSVLDRILAEAK
jgi:hypothetical protein